MNLDQKKLKTGRPTFHEEGVNYHKVTFALPSELHRQMRQVVAAEDHPYTQSEFLIQAVKAYMG